FTLSMGLLLADEPEPERRYSLGPLTPADFRGTRPEKNEAEGLDFAAYLKTSIRWQMAYLVEPVGKQFRVKLTAIDIFAARLPQQSYNFEKDNRQLMDHEQGHFDVAAIFCMEQRIKYMEAVRAGKPLQATSKSTQEAADEITKTIDAQLKDWHTSLDQ